MPSLPGIVELVEIASIAHNNGVDRAQQRSTRVRACAKCRFHAPVALSPLPGGLGGNARSNGLGIVCRSVAAVAAVAVETVAPDR